MISQATHPGCTTSSDHLLITTAPVCPVLAAPANGQVDATVRDFGSVATYSCNDGFALNGEATRTCGDGEWTGEAPTCERMICVNILLFSLVSIKYICVLILHP